MEHTNADNLRAQGFTAFITIRELRERKLACLPSEIGVYVVLRTEVEAPVFLKNEHGRPF